MLERLRLGDVEQRNVRPGLRRVLLAVPALDHRRSSLLGRFTQFVVHARTLGMPVS